MVSPGLVLEQEFLGVDNGPDQVRHCLLAVALAGEEATRLGQLGGPWLAGEGGEVELLDQRVVGHSGVFRGAVGGGALGDAAVEKLERLQQRRGSLALASTGGLALG